MIKGFIQGSTADGECALHIKDASSIIPNINREIRALGKGDQLVFVCDDHRKDDPEFQMFPAHCIHGTEECEIADGFVDRPHKRIPKTRFSAFFGTGLDRILEGLGKVDEVVVTGVCTDICIFATAMDARYRDHKVTVPRDCVYPLDRARGDMLLRYLEEVAGVEVRG